MSGAHPKFINLILSIGREKSKEECCEWQKDVEEDDDDHTKSFTPSSLPYTNITNNWNWITQREFLFHLKNVHKIDENEKTTKIDCSGKVKIDFGKKVLLFVYETIVFFSLL